jgi:hypothetical protein
MMTAESDDLAAYQPQPRVAIHPARILMFRAKVKDLWPVTMIGFALSLTLAWTGLLMGLLWWGIAWLIGPAVS